MSTSTVVWHIETELADIRNVIADLRASWSWLDDLLEPGPETRPTPVLTDSQRSRLAAMVAAERAERASPGRWTAPGLAQWRPEPSSALAQTSTPSRIAVIDAQIVVRGLVRAAARRVAQHTGTIYMPRHSGDESVTEALDWLDGGAPAFLVDRAGQAWRRETTGALDQLRDPDIAKWVHRKLARADLIARTTAGVRGEPVIPFGHPCPACGRQSLQWHMPRPDPRYRRDWSVRCVSESCRCKGIGCGCRQRVRYEGRRHAWAYGELDGPDGLWRAILATRRPTRLRSTAAGHGGWAERRSE